MTAIAPVKFRKPPVVEVWISVEFEPNANKRKWDLELVQQYVALYKTELAKLEIIQEHEIQIREISPEQLPKVVGRNNRVRLVRVSNDDQTRVLQIGDDQLAFHVLRIGLDYPDYRTTREGLERKLEDYVRVFQPTLIRNATLNYLDIVDIPRSEPGAIDLRDYFVSAIDLPVEPFGLMTDFGHRFQADCPDDPGPLLLDMQGMPFSKESNAFQVRMEWHKQCSEVNTLNFDQVWSRMDIAHEYMRRCFNASFTPRTLQLFEPIAETT